MTMDDPVIGMLVKFKPEDEVTYTDELHEGMVGIVRDVDYFVKVWFPETGNPDEQDHWNQFDDDHLPLHLVIHGPRRPTAEEMYEILRSSE